MLLCLWCLWRLALLTLERCDGCAVVRALRARRASCIVPARVASPGLETASSRDQVPAPTSRSLQLVQRASGVHYTVAGA